MTLFFASEAANSWLLPGEVAEAVWSGIASLIVFGLLWWKALPPAKAAMAARRERIEAELDGAEAERAESEGRLRDVQDRIGNAEDERQRLLVEARQTADALKTQLVAKAEEDAAALKARAAADLEALKAQAAADLQAEVGRLALGAAEEVIARNLDASSQSELVDSYIAQVGATS